MKAFYSEWGIDIFKDVVSIPGESMQFVLRGGINREGKLWSSNKAAYDLLKAAVVGGSSLLCTRYHQAGVTRIRSHQREEVC